MAIGIIGVSGGDIKALPFAAARAIETKECKGKTSFTTAPGSYVLQAEADFFVYDDDAYALPTLVRAGEAFPFTTSTGTFVVEAADWKRIVPVSSRSTGTVPNGTVFSGTPNIATFTKSYISTNRQFALYHNGSTSDPYVTTDGGATYVRWNWQHVSGSGSDYSTSHLCATDDFSHIYWPLSNQNNQYRVSTDQGATWSTTGLSGASNRPINSIETVGQKFVMAMQGSSTTNVDVHIGEGTTRQSTFTIAYSNAGTWSTYGEGNAVVRVPGTTWALVINRGNSNPTYNYYLFDVLNPPTGTVSQTGSFSTAADNIHQCIGKSGDFIVIKATSSQWNSNPYNYFHMLSKAPNGNPALMLNRSAFDYQSASLSSAGMYPYFSNDSTPCLSGLFSAGRAGMVTVRQGAWVASNASSTAVVGVSINYYMDTAGSSVSTLNPSFRPMLSTADTFRLFLPDRSMGSKPECSHELPDGRMLINTLGNPATLAPFAVTLFEKA